MKRRQFVFTAATFALHGGCNELTNLGQPATSRRVRVGILDASVADDPISTDEIVSLQQGLAELGYLEGQTIVFEQRHADNNFARLPVLADELVQLPVDVLVTVSGSAATVVARQATTVIPIVFVGATDPVAKGFVASLDHPGGNVTGVTTQPPTVFGKLVEFLTQLVPGASRVVFVTNSDPALGVGGVLGPSGAQLTTTAANALGVQLKFLDVRTAEDVEPALAETPAWQAEAMILWTGAGAANDAKPRLVDFQLQNRIPMAVATKRPCRAVLTYRGSNTGAGRTAAILVGKILKGARPADLPVEEPTTFDLIVNCTARRRQVYVVPSERWPNSRAKLLQGANRETARPEVCRALSRSADAELELEKLGDKLDTAYQTMASNLPTNIAVTN